jgi:signal transduction histidine kinase
VPASLRIFRSLRSQLLAAFLLPTLVLFGVAGAAGYALSRRILEEELGRSLSAVAAAAASQVGGDRLLTIEPDDDRKQTRTYRSLLRLLSDIRLASNSRRIFAVDTEGRVRVDAGGSLPVGAQMPELSRDRSELSAVFRGSTAASEVLFEGSDRRLYKTGYAPVFQGQQVIGAVGVEGSAEFFRPLTRLFQAFAILVGAALALLAVIAVLTARGLSKPLIRLMRAALRIGGGDLRTRVPAEQIHEFGVLAQELELMRDRLESRTRQLQLMLAGVAHEVRNPLGGIALYAGVLSEELRPGAPITDGVRQHVAQIQREVDYLERIVDDFLEFAREERLAKTRCSTASVVEAAVELVRTEAAAHQNEIQLRAEAASWEVDQNLLIAAMVNLLKNALQASAAGLPVEVTGARRDGWYRIEVADRGSGIPEAIRERIFEPFFTTREQGTGLGLPLARKVVQAHGGEIAVHCSPGLTVFRVDLPLVSRGAL